MFNAKFAVGLCLAIPAVPHLAMAQAAPTLVEPSRSLDAMIADAEKEEVSLAEAMPAERYGFQPSAAEFKTLKPTFENVNSFVKTITHMAMGNYYYGSAASGLKPPAEMESLAKITDKDAAVKALKDSFAFLHKAAATITAANAFEHVGRSPESTRAVLLAGAVVVAAGLRNGS